MTVLHIPAFYYDSRGNRLLKVAERSVGSTGRVRLYAQCVDDVAAHLEECLAPWNPTALPLEEQHRTDGWSHRWELDQELGPDGTDIVQLLKGLLVLKVGKDLDVAIALDFYKNPIEDEQGNTTGWVDTEAGELVFQAKYWKSRPATRQKAWETIADRLADVVKRHPLLSEADAVVSVPGHVTTEWSVSERIAAQTAYRLGKPYVRTGSKHEERPEAKGDEADPAFDLENEFTVALKPHHRTVLIVDDVLRSGRTMSAVSRAARRAGATTVYGLACARTRRN